MLIRIKVFPKAKKSKIIKKSNNCLEVWVKKRPIKGVANKAVIEALATYFNLPTNKIRLIKGFRQRNKIFVIEEN